MVNILIVDDSSLTRKAIHRIIDMIGVDVGRVIEAGNGREALEKMHMDSVDLVLADLNMPEMGGIEMIDHMATDERTQSIPVIVISTESSTTRIGGLLSQGARNFLHKPFTPEQVKQVVEQTLGVSHV